MDVASTVRAIRDTGWLTAVAAIFVFFAQLPLLLAVLGRVTAGTFVTGGRAAWAFAAATWGAYAAVHLLAPLADMREQPDRPSWGLLDALTAYASGSVRQPVIRAGLGLLGVSLAVVGGVLFAASGALIALPVVVGAAAVTVLSAPLGATDPTDGSADGS
ncbi:hypothetical protein [Halobaculum sp. EA56]|uniref:hypothetical protein n=1 Tax=Halobaculum sp. EA56 TaxID=3421648 RepID=UPI003EBBADDC